MTLNEFSQHSSGRLVNRDSSVHPAWYLSLTFEEGELIRGGRRVAGGGVGVVAMIRPIGSLEIGGLEGIRRQVYDSGGSHLAMGKDFSPSNGKIGKIELGQSGGQG